MQSDNAISDGASEIQRGLEAFIPDDDGYYLTVLQRYEPADGKSPAVNRGALSSRTDLGCFARRLGAFLARHDCRDGRHRLVLPRLRRSEP